MKSNVQNEEFSDAYASAKSLLAQNLKTCRNKVGMSQEELGHKIGADQAYISRLEAGQLNPTLETIAELASVLSVSVGDFFNEDKSL